MKQKLLFFVLLVLAAAGCGLSEDCIKKSGDVTIRHYDAAPFTKISVFPGIALVVKQGPEYEVSVKSGENIIDDVEVKITGDMLTLKDNSGCNFVRSYSQTTVFVTAPNLEEIYSNTNREITSDGVLNYPVLRLFSMDFFDGVGTGDFRIEVHNSQLVIESNHVTAFHISGQTQQLLLNFYNGIGRFEGESLQADEIVVFHRGSNDMIVNPVNTLKGNIYSTGNLICKSQPATVEVVEHYSGRLIFE